MKYKCKICRLKFRAKELNIICPRCKRKGIVPYNDHSSGFFLFFALMLLWVIIFYYTNFIYPFYLWRIALVLVLGILGLGALVEFIFWIVRKTSDPKFYIDKLTGEVHYFSEPNL